MILRRLIAAAAAVGAALAAAAAFVVACVYGLFALFRNYIGPAGAGGGVALIIAVVFAIVLAVMMSKAKGSPKPKMSVANADAPLDRVLAVARERPIVAAAGAIAAGLIALRNPALIALVTRAFVEPKRPKPR